MFCSVLKDIRRHCSHYLILFSGLLLGTVAFFAFAGLPYWRIGAVILTGTFYFLWGMIHHIIDKDWHLKIALEYLLVAVLGCGLLLSIILRG